MTTNIFITVIAALMLAIALLFLFSGVGGGISLLREMRRQGVTDTDRMTNGTKKRAINNGSGWGLLAYLITAIVALGVIVWF